jgi:hypothetical protein
MTAVGEDVLAREKSDLMFQDMVKTFQANYPAKFIGELIIFREIKKMLNSTPSSGPDKSSHTIAFHNFKIRFNISLTQTHSS